MSMAMDDAAFQLARRKIASVLQFDIEQYKSQQMRRRLGSFVERRAGGDTDGFWRRLDRDSALAEELRDFLTINVSEFFRDPRQFAYLRSHILAPMLRSSGRCRIWSAGCAAGQETYSIAILLAELGALHRVRILGTDIDRKALARAEAGGPYRDEEVRHATRGQLLRFFRVADDGRRLQPDIVAAPSFLEHDLLGPCPETTFDLIVCRNAMIYFTAEAKAQLLSRLCDALVPGGVLFVGGTEGIGGNGSQGIRRLAGHFYCKARSDV